MQGEVLDDSDQRNKRLGQDGEALAAAFLRAKGYKILEKNYRCRLGEVDLIVDKMEAFGSTKVRKISFIEVKTRRSIESVGLQEVISIGKQRHISRVAQHYIAKNRLEDFDAGFGAVLVDLSSEKPKIEFLDNAFTLAWGY